MAFRLSHLGNITPDARLHTAALSGHPGCLLSAF